MTGKCDMRYLMGIDLGTSSVKAMITDENGVIHGLGQVGYEIHTPEIGYVQQDPLKWWTATKEAVRQAIKCVDFTTEKIQGIGLSGQMHGMVALDENKKVLYPAIIHLDARSTEERKIIQEIAADLIQSELMNQPSTGMMICSLLWIKNHMEQQYEKIRYVLSPKDYIRFQLTGEISSEVSDASATLAFSVKNRSWCKALFKRLDLKEDICPKVLNSQEIAGTITKEVHHETGLPENTKVVAGAGDCFAAMVGNGIIKTGIMTCNIGTSSQIAVVTDKPICDSDMQCQLWCHAVPGVWAYQGGALNGGGTLSWAKNKMLCDGTSFEELDREIQKVPAGSNGITFLPYLAGERTPFNNPKARGVYYGLNLKQGKYDMLRATVEGVLYNLMECKKIFDAQNLPQEMLIASGGGARGMSWKQIQADMFAMPVYTTETVEEACMGAAVLAAVGTGIYGNIEEACKKMVKIKEKPVEPIWENHVRYKEGLQIFEELYDNLKGMFEKNKH